MRNGQSWPPSIFDVKSITDSRGNLSIIESNFGLTFQPQRIFWVDSVPLGEERGMHAHKECQQILICTKGSILVTLDNGFERHEFSLTKPSQTLFMDRGIWGEQVFMEPESQLLVLASMAYDESDYLRDYSAFLAYASDLRQELP